MSVNSKMTAIADKIRAILGITGTMGMDAMATHLENIEIEVDEQHDLIKQMKTLLFGKQYPEGALIPVTSFTDGKKYALVAIIDGVYRYINTTTYNNYTMNATQVTVAESGEDYVVFDTTPALFTAVASGDGFLLQNGTNYLHGTSSGGTALRVGTTQAVWTVDTSETGGFSSGKYYAKENPNAVWLFNKSGNYNWSIKYETAGSFGYDRSGRDNTYSTGFVSFVLYEYYEPTEDETPPVAPDNNMVTMTVNIDSDGERYVIVKYVNADGEVAGCSSASSTIQARGGALFFTSTGFELSSCSGSSYQKIGTTGAVVFDSGATVTISDSMGALA